MSKTSFTTSLLVVLTALTLVSGAALAQTWDGGTATNNDDGGDDSSASSPSTTPSGDSTDSSTSDSWDGGSASNDDDGTSSDGWTGQTSSNEDDGSSTEWDGDTASNNNDGGDGETTWDGDTATNDGDGGSTTSTDSTSSSSGGGSGGGGSFTWEPVVVEFLSPGISFDMPSTVNVGETVDISGDLRYAGGVDVVVMKDGQKVSSTKADMDGLFSTSFVADEIGEHTITVKAKDETRTKQLEVVPTVDVRNVRSSVSYNSAASVLVCGDVESQVTPTVKLVRDGNTLATKSQKGSVCFNPSLSDGTHELKIVAEVDGNRDEGSTTIRINTPTGETSQQERTFLGSILQPFFQFLAGIFQFLAQLIPV